MGKKDRKNVMLYDGLAGKKREKITSHTKEEIK
jgi:hypothetical protein